MLEAQILPLLPESGQKLALILDLPIRISLACALPLAKAGFVPVPLVYRWPVEPSNVDAGEAAALLASLAPSPRGPTDPRGVALLLDSQRYDGTSRFTPAILTDDITTRSTFCRLRKLFWIGARPQS